ncbi:hypothetical protein AWC26_02875 [Mycobacterium shimoidei]|nr:hypothetical protein BHQ16_12300 [Mycobacterium shimoidei]ORW83363.1 hypothetical protein AWC26_02875 [Mycobacterium shimoidei]
MLNPKDPVLEAARAIEQNRIDRARATPLPVAVAATVLAAISPGEAKQVRSQLPTELQEILTAAVPA